MNYNSRDFLLGFIAGKLDIWREEVNGKLNEMLEYIYNILPHNIKLSQEEIIGLCGYSMGEEGKIMWYMGREPVIIIYSDYEDAIDYDGELADIEIYVICKDSIGDNWICESCRVINLHEQEEGAETDNKDKRLIIDDEDSDEEVIDKNFENYEGVNNIHKNIEEEEYKIMMKNNEKN